MNSQFSTPRRFLLATSSACGLASTQYSLPTRGATRSAQRPLPQPKSAPTAPVASPLQGKFAKYEANISACVVADRVDWSNRDHSSPNPAATRSSTLIESRRTPTPEYVSLCLEVIQHSSLLGHALTQSRPRTLLVERANSPCDSLHAVFRYHSRPRSVPEVPPLIGRKTRESNERIGKGNRIRRRHYQSSIPYQKLAISYVRHHAGRAARHRLSDGIRETLAH